MLTSGIAKPFLNLKEMRIKEVKPTRLEDDFESF
jgi:hypothetical protein